MTIWSKMGKFIAGIANIYNDIDTVKAEDNIRKSIYFKGPNVWILAFAIFIASIGLNVNSTAVIIGAMLISPLMGPIFGMGMGMGINDTALIRTALKNLLVMIVISLLTSFLFFLISPLNLANPTELEARTHPTIYDVMIALFGGAAGIFEMSRKEKGTVISGVAIATALMPPICTAGYGLAHGSAHFFFGALYLFFINAIFITLATYLMVKYLKFKQAEYMDEARERKNRKIISAVVILVAIPSVWSAFTMIQSNNFEQRVSSFVSENKTWDRSYIYDYKISGGKAELFIGGEPLKSREKESLVTSAANHGLKESQIILREQNDAEESSSDSEKLMKGIYERTDLEINRREGQIRILEQELEELRGSEIPYTQITREIQSQYPVIKELALSRGASVSIDSTSHEKKCILVVASTEKPLDKAFVTKLEDWLKIRLNDSTVVVLNKY